MKMGYEQIALKEWAVAIKALEEGRQILMLRKGGIAEETKDFRIKAPEFFLFPTYEHQKKELLKEEYRPQIDEIIKVWTPDENRVKITCYAKLVQDLELTDLEQVERLAPYHIWTERFAEERLRWKRRNPLHVLLLRIYRLERPYELPIAPSYLGCKSWIELQDKVPESIPLTPVLNDQEFQAKLHEIKAVLA
jgi:hypothetical protein